MKKSKNLNLALLSMFSAIIIVMTFIPYLGYITFPGLLSITTLHIAVIIGAVSLGTYSAGAVLGTVWGVTCLVYAIINGTADAAIFLDPRISVIPRILVGILVVAFYKLAKKIMHGKISALILKALMSLIIAFFAGLLCKNISHSLIAGIIVGVCALAGLLCLFLFAAKSQDALPVMFAAVLGTFSNTALVLTAINLFGSDGFIKLTGTIESIFSVVIALNGTIEMVAAFIIAVPCCTAVKKIVDKMD